MNMEKGINIQNGSNYLAQNVQKKCTDENKQFIFLCLNSFSRHLNVHQIKMEKFDRIWNLQGENFIFSSRGQKNRKKRQTRRGFTSQKILEIVWRAEIKNTHKVFYI